MGPRCFKCLMFSPSGPVELVFLVDLRAAEVCAIVIQSLPLERGASFNIEPVLVKIVTWKTLNLFSSRLSRGRH